MAKRVSSSTGRAPSKRPNRAAPPSRGLAESPIPARRVAPNPILTTSSGRVVSSPPLDSSPPLAAEAIGLFQTGMAALQRHEYPAAAEGFRSLLSRFPGERALLDRARVYLGLCERELLRHPTQPMTAEERLTAATAALNNGDEGRAEGLVRAVLAEDPARDLALYLSAAICARRGRRDEAVDQLRRAIASSPDVAAQAALDPDFDGLRDLEAFQSLTETPTSSWRARPMRH
jgi:tetratricopeptide (TPR) repeat protein